MVVPASTALTVWMNGEHVGRWFSNSQGTQIFEYAETWLASPRSRPLSLSLPILPGNEPHRGHRVADWFDNLLPDSAQIRDRLRSRFRTDSARAFDLLTAIGRDCVGAVQLVRDGVDPGDIRVLGAEPMTDAEVARALRGVTSPDALGARNDDAFRISLAGAQEKLALTRIGTKWHRPIGATPTTHILKLPLGLIGNARANMRQSVENEWFCMQMLGELRLPVPPTEIATFSDEAGEERVLVVQRFDRAWAGESANDDGWLVRLPQEDFCQAMGLPSSRKYESDGGPGIPECLALLRAGQNADADALTFALAQLAFWLLAATDGHAKNFSIFLRRSGYVMTPLYDVISAWPVIGNAANEWAPEEVRLAMSLRGKRRKHWRINGMTVSDWQQLAARTGAPDAFEQMTAMVDAAEGALSRLGARLPQDFPITIRDRIAAGVRAQCERFRLGLQ
jgi:serine/threonine-protein kinase HipA